MNMYYVYDCLLDIKNTFKYNTVKVFYLKLHGIGITNVLKPQSNVLVNLLPLTKNISYIDKYV